MHRLILLSIALLATLSGCTTEEERAAALEEDSTERPESETWDAVLRITDGDDPMFRMTAPYAAQYSRDNSTVLELGPDPLGESTGRVSIELYSEEGRHEATVESDRATLVQETEALAADGNVRIVLHGNSSSETTAQRLRSEGEEVILSGNVVMKSNKGERLTTSMIRYDRAAERIYAPGRFEVRTATEWVRGTGLEARSDLSRYTFGDATGEFEVQE